MSMISREQIVKGAQAREVLLVLAFAILACIGIAIDRQHGVPIYIFSIVLIGAIITFLKKDNVRVAGLFAIVILSICSIAFNGIKFGIDFSGGVRIPILLEKAVDSATMDEMVTTIKKRSAAFGLTEVRVRPIGDSEIYVEVPQSSPQLVSQIENLLSQQGVYQGIVDGKLAISGDDIYTDNIVRIPPAYLHNADWGISFTVTQSGAQRFAAAAKGKANYPLYMFLDRPSDVIVIINDSRLLEATGKQFPLKKERALQIARNALKLEGQDIPLYLESEVEGNLSILAKHNITKIIIENGSALENRLRESGFILLQKTREEMTPQFSYGAESSVSDAVVSWKAVGLISAPRLVPGVTEGIPSFAYSITGFAEGNSPQERAQDALKKEKELESLLKGGALPVQITLGSKTVVPAALGEEFLRLSLIGVVVALFVVSLMVAFRYRHLRIIAPMITISCAEIIIMMAILGSFTIDLSTMAGMLAAIGVSVDAQIIVTDELLKKEEIARKKLEKAFGIISTSVLVAVVAMLPLLLFSGLVEIIGFATATVLGPLLGLFISRPAYGAIIEHIFE
ncbi:MAG: hypothetical protein N3G80_00685 [Candidatus Micrarchaeota archaeon]|nr:hypothetical protein [Candidatus Micrarchaeota archaeon]